MWMLQEVHSAEGLSNVVDDPVLLVFPETSNGDGARTPTLALPAPPSPPLDGPIAMFTNLQARLSPFRGVLHAVFCVVLGMGWVPHGAAKPLMVGILCMCFVLWTWVSFAPAGGWQRWFVRIGEVCLQGCLAVFFAHTMFGLDTTDDDDTDDAVDANAT